MIIELFRNPESSVDAKSWRRVDLLEQHFPEQVSKIRALDADSNEAGDRRAYNDIIVAEILPHLDKLPEGQRAGIGEWLRNLRPMTISEFQQSRKVMYGEEESK